MASLPCVPLPHTDSVMPRRTSKVKVLQGSAMRQHLRQGLGALSTYLLLKGSTLRQRARQSLQALVPDKVPCQIGQARSQCMSSCQWPSVSSGKTCIATETAAYQHVL
eukprot:scaffold210814_cov34-Prasinocladus_malaysianus.AAC.1